MGLIGPVPSLSGVSLLRLFFLSYKAGVMHPDEVPGKYPGQGEQIDRPEKDTAKIAPYKTRQRLKQSPVQLHCLAGAHRKVAAGETDHINDFSTQNT